MTYLVDTDWVVDYLKGRLDAIALLDQLARAGIAISAVTYGEVYEGLAGSADPQREETSLRRFTRGIRVLSVDRRVARRYGLIRRFLRDAGQLIRDPDIFIAATAMEHDLIVVTRNREHFRRVPDLRLYAPT